MLIRYDGKRETIVPEAEPDTDVMLFSFLPGLSRTTSRIITESPIHRAGQATREDDTVYFRRRASQELELAETADSEKAAHSHYLLAALYLDRASQGVSQERETEAHPVVLATA